MSGLLTFKEGMILAMTALSSYRLSLPDGNKFLTVVVPSFSTKKMFNFLPAAIPPSAILTTGTQVTLVIKYLLLTTTIANTCTPYSLPSLYLGILNLVYLH